MQNPLAWSQKKTPRKKSKRKNNAAARSITTPAKKACTAKANSPDVMIFDPKLGKLVVVVSDEEGDGWKDDGWESEA